MFFTFYFKNGSRIAFCSDVLRDNKSVFVLRLFLNFLPKSLLLFELKKKASPKQKQKGPQIMPQVAKNKDVDSDTEIENTSVDFNTLNYSKESISTYGTDD